MCDSHPAKTAIEEASRLAVARNLARLYAEILNEPLPPPLEALLGRLQETQDTAERPQDGGRTPEV